MTSINLVIEFNVLVLRHILVKSNYHKLATQNQSAATSISYTICYHIDIIYKTGNRRTTAMCNFLDDPSTIEHKSRNMLGW